MKRRKLKQRRACLVLENDISFQGKKDVSIEIISFIVLCLKLITQINNNQRYLTEEQGKVLENTESIIYFIFYLTEKELFHF